MPRINMFWNALYTVIGDFCSRNEYRTLARSVSEI